LACRKNRENVLAATLYTVCLQQHKYLINDVKSITVSATKEDIYQHCKQFQHFLLLATLYASLSLPDKNFQPTLYSYSFQRSSEYVLKLQFKLKYA